MMLRPKSLRDRMLFADDSFRSNGRDRYRTQDFQPVEFLLNPFRFGGGGGGGGITWYDDFSNSATLAAYNLYQNSGGTSYAITGGALVASGGSSNQSYLLYDGPLFTNGWAESVLTSADQAGIVLNGLGSTSLDQGYLLTVRDGSSSILPNTFALFRIQSGGITTLITNTAISSWTRGTARTFRLTVSESLTGTLLTIGMNGSTLTSFTDAKSLPPGKAGVNVFGALANGFNDYGQDGTESDSLPTQYLNPGDANTDVGFGFLNSVFRAASAANAWRGVRSILPIGAGEKRYFEFKANNNAGFNYFVGGVATTAESLSVNSGAGPFGWGYEIGRGLYYHNGGSSSIIGGNTSNGVIGQVAYDDNTGQLWFGLDNTWVGNPAAGTGQTAITGASPGSLYPIFSLYSPGAQCKVNQMSADQVYAAPSGFSGW